ncbi:MBG domain-containing protein [Granulicella aggregans]|uniref:MBG domain-containing protein n=1 Tax=Granulicella aggregans TaxID=474949 RepID=UPI0021DF43C6|nr:MBG domain-containing protein [Granulicella aggregans]
MKTSRYRAVGASNPALTDTVSGFIDGDTASAVSGTAALTTTATTASPEGKYPITFSSEVLAAANYSFNYVTGILTVTPASCETFNYSSGFIASGLSLNGGATIAGNALELTDGRLFEARSAFFSTALPTVGFTTDFTFQINDPVADGMAFVIQSNSSQERRS